MTRLKNDTFFRRLAFASAGVRAAWRRERSFRTQAVIALAVVPMLILLRPAMIWWALTGIMIALVLAAELVNSALELLTDHLHPDEHPRIKLVKDMAVGAVLLLCIGAIWIGGLLVLSVL